MSVSCQLSVVSCQLSVVSCQLSVNELGTGYKPANRVRVIVMGERQKKECRVFAEQGA
jgi:hypothetical protein